MMGEAFTALVLTTVGSFLLAWVVFRILDIWYS